MSNMAILLRRELWENRAITAAPAIIGGLLLVMTILAVVGAISISVGDDPVDVPAGTADPAADRFDATVDVQQHVDEPW